ncbi:uncharacterized protein LOC143206802 isoform X2 [Rhynchophorus ferrugineus]|uniref:uncharacterized protein LOC143206802 isoform X2 n=1 Tax=Rhynchophorus ferrugineus TaxID=354439 RepID=UPI003FCC5B1E
MNGIDKCGMGGIKHEKSGLFITHNGKAGNGRGTGWNVEATPKAELHLAGHTGFNSAINNASWIFVTSKLYNVAASTLSFSSDWL